MSIKILEGKSLSYKIQSDLKKKIYQLTNKPGLAVVIVGDDPASQIYVENKIRACREIGFYSEKITLPETTSKEKIFSLLTQLNHNEKINGILVQFPFPERLQYLENEVINLISPKKDVDGLHPVNAGKLFRCKKIIGNNLLIPCTPKGIIRLLKEYKITFKGKNAVVCGRSNLVGKPVAILLLLEGATVTICHSQTKNIKEITSKADILISAVGKANFINENYVKKGAVVVDVGINRLKDKIVGDVDFDSVCKKAGAITPVPGGIGKMTIAMLMENVYLSYLYQKNIKE